MEDKQSRHDKTIGGRLRQRLAQILVSSSCATTSATTIASPHQEPATHVFESRPSTKPNDDRCSSERAPLVHISIDCSVGAAAVLPYSSPMPMGGVNKQAVVTKSRRRSNKGNKNKNKTRASLSYYYGWSSSSSTDDTEFISSDNDGDRRQGNGEAYTTTRSSTLFSSRSFSSDSTSDFYNTKNRRRRPRRAADDKRKNGASKRKNAAAVVKRSHDPYADFRSSMVEMVAVRRIRGADALTELLVWYLSLNSPRHHPVILSAFHDVWEAVLSS